MKVNQNKKEYFMNYFDSKDLNQIISKFSPTQPIELELDKGLGGAMFFLSQNKNRNLLKIKTPEGEERPWQFKNMGSILKELENELKTQGFTASNITKEKTLILFNLK